MAETSSGFLRWDDFIYVLDFYERNGIRAVSMLGGEPTVHPDVHDLMDYALQRGFDLRVFTSGITSESTRARIGEVCARVPTERVHFIVNVNHPSDTPAAQGRSQRAFLEQMGSRASLSFNIYRSDFDLDFAFEYIATYDLARTLRLGLAHPIAAASEGNAFVPPARYHEIATQLMRWVPAFDRNFVAPGFDCGFPLCMFDDAQLGALTRLNSSFHWTCGPVVDIGPDLELWPCFPLSHLRGKTLYDFESMNEILDYFGSEVRARRKGNTGVFVECDECPHRERGMCGGGCLTFAITEEPLEGDHSARRLGASR
jgi:cyclic pyranopterin phosphate synthase